MVSMWRHCATNEVGGSYIHTYDRCLHSKDTHPIPEVLPGLMPALFIRLPLAHSIASVSIMYNYL